MIPDDDDEGFFSFLGPVEDGPTLLPIASAPPAYLSPPSVQAINIDSFDSPSYSPSVGDGLPSSLSGSVPDYYPWVSPPSPETYFIQPSTPFDVINLGTRNDQVSVPQGTDDFSLADLIDRLGNDDDERSPSLSVAPLAQPIGQSRAAFESLTDLDFSSRDRSRSSGGRSVLLALLAIAALFLLD